MKIHTLPKLNEFLGALNECQGYVWLETNDGDRFNLMSVFSQYLAFEKLLSEQWDKLELTCMYKEDEVHFAKFCFTQNN